MSVLTGLDGVDDDWLRGVLYGNAARLFGLTHS
jgi:predicted TIM-barrel fold metal-dependent hydrolase